jgi:hypothetical protein
MREVAMATGTSYRTPGTLPSQASGFVGREAGDDRFWRLPAAGAATLLDEAVARALSDTCTFGEPA